jgi:predicted phage tail protein
MDATPFISKGAANSTRGGSEIVTVAWESTNEESGSIIIMLVALGLSVIIGLGVAIRFAAVDTQSDGREIQHEADEEDGRVDRFAEMLDEDGES